MSVQSGLTPTVDLVVEVLDAVRGEHVAPSPLAPSVWRPSVAPPLARPLPRLAPHTGADGEPVHWMRRSKVPGCRAR